MYPRLRPCWRLAATPLYWEGYRPCLCRELHPVLPWLVAPFFSVALLPRSPLLYAVLGLVVRSQWPLRQVLPALRAANSLPLSLLLAHPFPRHLLGIGFVIWNNKCESSFIRSTRSRFNYSFVCLTSAACARSRLPRYTHPDVDWRTIDGSTVCLLILWIRALSNVSWCDLDDSAACVLIIRMWTCSNAA